MAVTILLCCNSPIMYVSTEYDTGTTRRLIEEYLRIDKSSCCKTYRMNL